jgi:DNA-binding NtrC family response regulator
MDTNFDPSQSALWETPEFVQDDDVPDVRHVLPSGIDQRHLRATAGYTRPDCILIVDDNESVRETLADLLELADFVPVQAADAAQALMILRARTDIDALVTDLSMPGADGITLIRQARAIKADMPAILLTGYAEEVSSISTIAGGNFHVLRKPVESDRLIEQLLLLIHAARQG